MNPGIESSQIMAGLVIGKIATTRTTRYRLNCMRNAQSNRAVKLHVSSLAHGSF